MRIPAFRLALLLLIIATAWTALADRYAVTLDPTAAIGREAALAAELAQTYGVTVTSAEDGALIVDASPAKARALASDPRVKLVARNPLRTKADAVVEPVNWTTGVSYTYDGAGDIVKLGTDEFLYDDLGRLVQAKVNGATRKYEYDAFGNRKSCSDGATDCQFGYQTSPSTNRLTLSGGITYDLASGNVTRFRSHDYTYDALQMMNSDTVSSARTEFIYTADDERIATHASSGSWQWTVRAPNGKVLRELTSQDSGTSLGSASWKWTKDYVWRGDELLASRQPETDGVTTYHYHLDHLGTPRRITNDNDEIVAFHDYYAFGPEVFGGLNEPSRTDLKYTGHERNTDGEPETLDYLHARYYSPSMGRFLSLDPARGEARRPQTWNRYSYTFNNPLKHVDETGAWPSERVWTVFGVFDFRVHQWAIDRVLGFLSDGDLEILKNAQITADLDQDRQYKHAMSLPGQNKAQATAQANAYIRNNMTRAINAEKQGKHSLAMFHLGMAIHTLQDATSPAHAGYQEFNPKNAKYSWPTIQHVLRELEYPSTMGPDGKNLQYITYNAYAYWAWATGNDLHRPMWFAEFPWYGNQDASDINTITLKPPSK